MEACYTWIRKINLSWLSSTLAFLLLLECVFTFLCCILLDLLKMGHSIRGAAVDDRWLCLCFCLWIDVAIVYDDCNIAKFLSRHIFVWEQALSNILKVYKIYSRIYLSSDKRQILWIVECGVHEVVCQRLWKGALITKRVIVLLWLSYPLHMC